MVAPKGFGSENMSKIHMLKPADGVEGVKEAIVNTVREAGPNACPPVVVGVGIGGTFEKAAILAKKALTREIGTHSELPHIKELNINTYATHIAGLPVAVNICCHVNRHIARTI